MSPSPRRPNILLLMTDQQSADAISCAGIVAKADLHTPHLDALAGRGLRFTRAHCTFPLCTPSRASMLTGRMPSAIGVTQNPGRIPPHLANQHLGPLLAAAGYDCYYGGKWHLPSGAIPEGQGFTPIAGFNDHQLTAAAGDFLLRRPADAARPFLLVASFDNPHNICEWARGEPLPWGPVAEPPPDAPADQLPALPANFEPGPDEPELFSEARAKLTRLYPTRDYTPERWRRYRHAYFRLVEKVDAQIGQVLAALRRGGHEESTLIVFLSDHGDGMGAHRWNQKTVLYDEVVCVPLMFAGAGVQSRSDGAPLIDTRLVSTGLDLLPTLCDVAGAARPADLPGLSLAPLLHGEEPATWREHVVTETGWGPNELPDATGRMVRTDRHKHCLYSRGERREQLFDLAADSGETHNLVGDADCAEVLAQLRALA
ncbi:MAG: sulfatase-like hydrolase/transferase [Planctomycetota bacterium]|nr:sulfatase-like hydrolase/transferase [Planctomycetota bacterium]